MQSAYKRTLLVVEQSTAITTCELAVENDCGGCSGCSGLRNSAQRSPSIDLSLDPKTHEFPVKIGDTIELEASPGMLLALSSVIYLSPLILMLFFMVCCGHLFPTSEAFVAIAAVIGLAVGLGTIICIGPSLRGYIAKNLVVRSTI